MMKTLIWNIRSVKIHKAFNRVHMLHKHHKFSLVAFLEPFQRANHISKYKRKLDIMQAESNINGKIWYFIDNTISVEITADSDRQITSKLTCSDRVCYTTLVYAKYSNNERLGLWDSIYNSASTMNSSWLVEGDFNVITNENEKIGGLFFLPNKYEDFSFCMNSCELFKINFKGSPFTWWNGRIGPDCIFKRLDRVVINQ